MKLRKTMLFSVLAAPSVFAATPVTRTTPLTDAELTSVGSAVQSSLPEGSTVLAVCGPSEGMAYYLWPEQKGWSDDFIARGRIIFVADKDNKPNIIYQDAFGQFSNAMKDGAVTLFTFGDPKTNSFGVVETYPSTGVTQTYVVSHGPDKKRYALWTTIKFHLNVADISKVSAYLSHCI